MERDCQETIYRKWVEILQEWEAMPRTMVQSPGPKQKEVVSDLLRG